MFKLRCYYHNLVMNIMVRPSCDLDHLTLNLKYLKIKMVIEFGLGQMFVGGRTSNLVRILFLWSSCVTSCSDPGATFCLDPVTLIVKSCFGLNVKLPELTFSLLCDVHCTSCNFTLV